MMCPQCQQSSDQSTICPHCGFDITQADWVVICKVTPPDDIIIESLLISQGIPVKLLRKEVAQVPFSIGPMAEVKIMVPEPFAADAQMMLETNSGEEEI